MVVSNSEDSISMTLIVPSPKKKKKKCRSEQVYVSPYKQDKISIQKIMKSKHKKDSQPFPFTNLVFKDYVEPAPKSKSPKNLAKSKYRNIPSMVERKEKHEVDKMKV